MLPSQPSETILQNADVNTDLLSLSNTENHLLFSTYLPTSMIAGKGLLVSLSLALGGSQLMGCMQGKGVSNAR